MTEDPVDETLPTEPEPCLRLADQLCFALYSASSAVVRAYRPLLHAIGLTYPQYLVMMALWEGDDIGVGDLGGRLGLPLNSISPILDRLETSALLERHRARDDRRIVNVVLTDSGRALEEQAARVQHQVRCQTELTPAELAALREELHALVEVLDGR